MRLAIFALLVLPAPASHLSDALDLQRKGKLKESYALLQAAVAELHVAGDAENLAPALSACAKLAISLGDYRAAIQSATEAIGVRKKLKEPGRMNEDYNTIGLANVYLGNYDGALANYHSALEFDRAHHDLEGEVERENNIGNVFYYRGQYQDALRAYQRATNGVDAGGSQSWVSWRRQLTTANLAALYQRLGTDQRALELYQQITASPQSLPPDEYAQLLLNEGVLYRRLGDPVKALEWYGRAQAVFAKAHHRDGEIGALRNIGIVRAIDLDDLAGALGAFSAAWKLAAASSDQRGMVQAMLYRGEVFRRLGRMDDAEKDLQVALAGATKVGLVEERWKAQYGLGRVAEAEGRPDRAADLYGEAIAGIESIRAGIDRPHLRGDFLADKRDVYDSLIALTLRQPGASFDAVFSLTERSRARSLEERSGKKQAARSASEVQAALPADAVLAEYWCGEQDCAALWMTHSASGITNRIPGGPLQQSAGELLRSIESGGEEWKRASRELGRQLLSGIPLAKHFVVVPDGPSAAVPFEVLTSPETGRLLIESCDVSHLPAARLLQAEHSRRVIPPWRTQLLAYGDPPVTSAEALVSGGHWESLPAAKEEIESIAAILPGRSDVHLGANARKEDLLSRRLEGISMLHFTTHALADTENPDRSRILMASNSPSAPADYLFQREVYTLDLRGVELATISACETARGKVLRGDGPQALSQAFLAAGADATVTSLWRVSDRATAEFMKQFYYSLARGESKSAALRSAKLRFLNSGSAWRSPRYWSAFVLNGDGLNAVARGVSWTVLIAPAASLVLICRLWLAIRGNRGGAATDASTKP